MATVDLHLHTTASDGRLTPTQLIDLVAERGLQTVSLTDHDTTEGLPEAFEAAQRHLQLTLIPGIELSTDMGDEDIHLLGYFIDPSNKVLQETLGRYRQGRVSRAQTMVQKLRDLGILIEWDRVLEIAGEGSVGRPHIALAMVEKGYIKTPQEAFQTYLGNNGLAHAEREKLSPRQSVELLQEAGGAAVLAHPAYLQHLDDVIEELKSYGIVGMEVHYAEYSGDTRSQLASVAERYDLIPCGGSDYHALGNPNEQLPGTLGPPIESVEQLKSRSMAARNSPSDG